MVIMSDTGPEFHFSTMTTVISKLYGDMEDVIYHFRILILKSCLGKNDRYFCATILADT